MTDRNCVRAPTLTMRGSVREPLEPLSPENCMPIQAVIVKNGRIFVDNISPLAEDTNDENRKLEEEIDRLTAGSDDDDSDYGVGGKFSQEAFETFMRANDSDDDMGDATNDNYLHECEENGARINEELSCEQRDYVKCEYRAPQEFCSKESHLDMLPSTFHQLSTVANGRPVLSEFHSAELDKYTSRSWIHNFEENSSSETDVSSLMKEDFDISWRYVPLYPESYYSSGQEVQRVSVITDLPNLLRDNNAECMRRVVPKVREVLHVANIDMQLAAATAFLQILERKLVTVDEYKKTFLQTVLTSVDNKIEEVANAWLETLLSCIDLLPKDVVEKDVLSIAVNKGQLCQTLQARLSCCKILGKVSSKFDHFVIKNDVLPVVLSLCGDVEYEVRACMCQRLDVVARGLGLELTKSKLLPQLIELSEDESQNVLCACLETTVSLIGMLDREAIVNAIIPMVKELLEKATHNVDTTLPVASRLFGQLCHCLQEFLSVGDKTYFLEYFKKLCRTGLSDKKNKEETIKMMDGIDIFETTSDANTETRQNAAYNFPAMVVFAEPRLFRSELYSCFSHLCRDPHVTVRKTMAAGFHEVAKLLGANIGVVFPELNALLHDPDIEILKAVIPNFQEIISPLAALGFEQFTEHRAHVVQDVVSIFLRAESSVFNSPCWRLQEAMMKSMESLYLVCSNEYVYHTVVPLLLEKLRNGRALPVRIAAAKTLTIITRHLKYRSQREEIVQKLIDEFHRSKSCYRRSLFIDLARCYLQTNSKQAFKDHFYDYILNMKSDHVATVRLKMLTIFPDMKRSLKLPRDQTLRTALDTVLRQIIVYDKDGDVQYAAQQISEELSTIQEGSDNTRANRRNFTVEEIDDLKKEEEEKEFLAREEKERKEEEARAAKGSEKRNSICGSKKDAQSKIPSSKKGCGPMKVTSSGGSKGDGPHQPVTRKTSQTAITSVNITNKASTPSLTATSASQKPSSPLANKKSQLNVPSASPSTVAANSSSRRGSGGNLSFPRQVPFGSSAGNVNENQMKTKVVVSSVKTSNTSTPSVARTPKKPGK